MLRRTTTPLERVIAYVNDSTQITDEQRDAILSNERIVVVRACPGSGKTRLFAARFVYEVTQPVGCRGGVAALSFTNVAQREVVRRVDQLGMAAGYPHFVGTIDSFLLRFVVMRFGQELVNLPRFTHPLPDGDFSIQQEQIKYGNAQSEVAALSHFRIEPGSDGKACVLVQPARTAPWQPVQSDYWKVVVDAKQAVWRHGKLTYSDVCAVAWKLLHNKLVTDIVVSRFPVILIDEFQDTGGVREACIQKLLRSRCLARSMLVGDPDQCIMQFAGARPELFDQFEAMSGAKALALTGCHRSYSGVTDVARQLQRAGKGFKGLRDGDLVCQTLLTTHNFGPRSSDLQVVTEAFKSFIGNVSLDETGAALLAWRGSDVGRLSGTNSTRCPLEGSKWNLLFHGLSDYHAGNAYEFFESVERVFSVCIFDCPRPSDDQLKTLGLTRTDWKRLVWSLACETCIPRKQETLKDWGARVQSGFQQAGEEVLKNGSLSLRQKLRLKVENAKDRDVTLSTPAIDFVSLSTNAYGRNLLVEKVHQVKGREFDAVCFFVPKPDSRGLGALDAWFGHTDSAGKPRIESFESGEARRVAYVAMTRARRKLMVVIPHSWYVELCMTPHGRDFVDTFGAVSSVST